MDNQSKIIFDEFNEHLERLGEVDTEKRNNELDWERLDWGFAKVTWALEDIETILCDKKINNEIDLIYVIVKMDWIYEFARDLETFLHTKIKDYNSFEKDNQLLMKFKLIRDLFIAHPMGVTSKKYDEYKDYMVKDARFGVDQSMSIAMICDNSLEIEELFDCDKEYKNCERIYLLLSSDDSEKYIFFKENHLLNILEEIKRWYIQIKEGYERIIQ